MKTLIPLLLLLGSCCIVYGQKNAVIGTMVSKPHAILVLNPPNSDQGFLLPQLTTSQRQSITPASPGEDGLIVFDTTDKSFYYWKNNAWVKGLGADGAAVPTLAYDAGTQKLSLSTGGEVNLSALKEIPSMTANNGKFLTTDGTTLSWATVSDLGDISNIIAGAGLTGGATSGDATLSVNTDGVTLGVNGSNQLELKNGAVNTGKLAAGAVTSAQLATDAVTTTAIQAGAVTNAKIAPNAVAPANIASGGNNKILTTDATGVVIWTDQPAASTDNQALSFVGSTLAIDRGNSVSLSASGQVTGALNNLVVQNDVITSVQLANDAVGASELANGAVDAAAIQGGVIGTTHLVSGGNSKVLATDATGVVTWVDRTTFDDDNQNLSLSGNTLNIDNGASADLGALSATGQVAGPLTNLIVQNDVITSAQLATDAVGAAELANGAVDAAAIQNHVITSAQLATDAVGATELASGAVDGAAIQTGVVGTAHLVSGGNSKVLTTDAAGLVGWADRTSFTDAQDLSLTGNTLNIDNGASANLNTLTASGQVAGALNNLVVQNDVITSAQLANDAVGTAELASGAVDGAAIQSGVVGTAHLVSGGNSKVLTTDAAGLVGWTDRTSFTDAQDLSLTGNILNIDNGASANLNTLAALGQVAGALNNLIVQNDVITSAQLANDAVGAAELANGAVDAAAIQNDVITASQLANDAVGAAELANGAVDGAALQSGVVGTTHLVSGGNNKVLTTDATGVVGWADRTSFTDAQDLSLTGNTLNIDNGASANLNTLTASGQVAGALNNLVIQNDVVTSTQLANDAVGAAELANGAVDGAALQSGVVGTTHLVSGGNSKVLTTDATGVVGWADRTSFTDAQDLSLTGNTLNIDNGASANLNTLTASGQVAGALNNLVVQNDVITSAQLANDAVGAAELANGAVDAAAIQNDVITALQLANDAVGAAELANGAVDGAALQSGVVGTTHLVSGGNSKVLTTDATGIVGWADRTSFTDAQDLSLTGNTLNIDNGASANLNTLTALGQVAGALNNLVVQNDVITAAQLANDAVGATELANGAVDGTAIQSSVVATTHLVSGGNSKVLTTDATGVVGWADRTSFTDAQDLSLTGNTLNIDNGTSTNLDALTASGQVAGALNNLVVQNDVITSAQLANDAVGAAELANGAVDAAAIQNDVITALQLANDAVGAAELANGAVDAAAIQNSVVGTAHVVSGGNNKVMTTDATGVVAWADRSSFIDDNQNLSLLGNTLSIDNGTSADLNALAASGQVAGALNNLVVQNDVITSAQLANDAVGAAELANGSVDAAAIQNDVITAAQLANDAVGAAELANNAVDANAIQTGVVNTTHLASGGNNKVMTTDATGVVNWADRTALPVTGDVTGTLGAATVTKLQSHDIAATAPGAGQALVWNGTAWAPQAITVTPTTQYYAIDPANFTALQPTNDNKTITGFFEGNNTFVTANDKGDQLIAPVNLPHNASIDGITVYYLNNDVLLLGTIKITLYRKSFTGGNQQMATTTVGLSLTDATVNLPAIPAGSRIVDNSTYSYRIVVELTDSATGVGALDTVQRIYGIRIQYSK